MHNSKSMAGRSELVPSVLVSMNRSNGLPEDALYNFVKITGINLS